jgi:hypothetical protein
LWQARLAPAEKRSVLASLTDEEIKGVFNRYAPLFQDMTEHLATHGNPPTGARHANPCIFRLGEWATNRVEAPGGLAETDRRMFEWVQQVRLDTGWLEAAQGIRDAVRALPPLIGTNTPVWSVATFSRDAATAALAHRNLPLAEEIVEAALRHFPASDDLLYLQRLVERELGRPPGGS